MEDETVCRVCQSEGTLNQPLCHPCICKGSMRWIHEDCLLKWLMISRKKNCTVCGYRFLIKPIYSPDMPSRLPLRDILRCLKSSIIMTTGRNLIDFSIAITCVAFFLLYYISVKCAFESVLGTWRDYLDLLELVSKLFLFTNESKSLNLPFIADDF